MKMGPLFLIAVVTACGQLGCSPAEASSGGPGAASADFLRVTPDCRSAALGNSGVAGAESGFAVYSNPALLSRSGDVVRVAGAQTEWAVNVRAAHYAVSTAWAMGGSSWGLGAFFSDWRTDSFDSTDGAGSVIGKINYGAQNYGAALAHQIHPLIHVGAAVKKVTQNFAENGAAGTSKIGSVVTAWDFGFVLDTTVKNITLAGSLQNVGNEIRFVSEEEKLPETVRLGAQGTFLNSQLTWLAELERSGENSAVVKSGFAYAPFPAVSVRMGYDSHQRDSTFFGMTTGIGFRAAGFDVDYAVVPLGDLGLSQRVSMTWRFGRKDAEKTKDTWAKEHKKDISNRWADDEVWIK